MLSIIAPKALASCYIYTTAFCAVTKLLTAVQIKYILTCTILTAKWAIEGEGRVPPHTELFFF